VQVAALTQLFNIATAARKIMTFLGEKPNIPVIMASCRAPNG